MRSRFQLIVQIISHSALLVIITMRRFFKQSKPVSPVRSVCKSSSKDKPVDRPTKTRTSPFQSKTTKKVCVNVSNRQLARLADSCGSMNFRETLRETKRISSESIHEVQRISNICQYWLMKINAGLMQTDHRLSLLERASNNKDIRRCMSSLSTSLDTFKEYAATPEVHHYVVENLIKGSVLIGQILHDTKMTPRNRYILLQRYPLLVRLIYDPESVDDWRLNRTGEAKKVYRISNTTIISRNGSKSFHREQEDSEYDQYEEQSDESWLDE